MNEELFENPVGRRTALPLPHFEDRRVVMRAQPVVPLDEIRTKVKLRRVWFLSGAFAVAMMLGAASALVAVRVKRIAASNEIPQIAEPETATPETDTAVAAQIGPAEVDSAQVDTAQLDMAADAALVEEAPTHSSVKPTVTARKREAPLAERPRIVGRDSETLNSRQPSEEEQLEQIREAVLYEQWQERRLRRAARRERRNRAGDRDLSRVNEIFEGPRRPERP
jgi:hypothetical protein